MTVAALNDLSRSTLMIHLKTLFATAAVAVAAAGCHTPSTTAAGGTAPATGVNAPAGNTAGLPRNDTTGANVAQNCTSAVTDADRERCLSRGTAPTSPSERPRDGGS